jgi:DNA-binding response OmpR family regulator
MIVEDDETIAGAISRHIGTWGFIAHTAVNLRDIMPEFVSFDPQLVLLDICLPFYDGYYWCSEIRKVSKVPVIFISSASDNMNIVMAVGMGGDDFIAKPFDLSVLTAKVQALLRRTYDFGGSSYLIGHKNAVLNVKEAVLTYYGERIELSKNEYRILYTLMENKGRIVSREQIMTKLWETDSYIDDNTLTVNIARLRKKLSDAGLTDFITTKKGMGYVIE